MGGSGWAVAPGRAGVCSAWCLLWLLVLLLLCVLAQGKSSVTLHVVHRPLGIVPVPLQGTDKMGKGRHSGVTCRDTLTTEI